MRKKRRSYSPAFKAKVAFEAIKNVQTISELASEHKLHPVQIRQWKQQLLAGGADTFQTKKDQIRDGQEELESKLYEEIGRLKVELDWLKKRPIFSVEESRNLIEPNHPTISIARQCELLGLAKASYYYLPVGESTYNLELMRLIDEEYLKAPFYGSRRMTAILNRKGYEVNRKRIQRLMRLMGIEGVIPSKKTSIPDRENRIYPYLLNQVTPDHPNQVWSVDITYVPMLQGFMYLVAIIDWYSRYVVAWEISNTMDVQFCLEALEKAFQFGQPEIFNSDQGSQFTSLAFSSELEERQIQISIDGRGRVFDNIFIERLWKSVKYEDIYLKEYHDGWQLDKGMEHYFQFYNFQRPHQSLEYRTPAEVYLNQQSVT